MIIAILMAAWKVHDCACACEHGDATAVAEDGERRDLENGAALWVSGEAETKKQR